MHGFQEVNRIRSDLVEEDLAMRYVMRRYGLDKYPESAMLRRRDVLKGEIWSG
jgi:hypothetical protein